MCAHITHHLLLQKSRCNCRIPDGVRSHPPEYVLVPRGYISAILNLPKIMGTRTKSIPNQWGSTRLGNLKSTWIFSSDWIRIAWQPESNTRLRSGSNRDCGVLSLWSTFTKRITQESTSLSSGVCRMARSFGHTKMTIALIMSKQIIRKSCGEEADVNTSQAGSFHRADIVHRQTIILEQLSSPATCAMPRPKMSVLLTSHFTGSRR